MADFSTPAESLDLASDAMIDTTQRVKYGVNENLVDSTSNAAADFATYAVPSVIAGFFDTVGTSLGLVDENKVGQILSNIYPNFGDYYTRNKQTIQTVSDLTGMFIPGTAGMKLAQSSMKLKELMGEGKLANYASKLLTSGTSADELLNGVSTAALYAAQQGYNDLTKLPALNALKRNAIATRMADSLKETLGFELAVGATMNSSETLFPSDQTMGDLLATTAGFAAIPVAAEGLFMKRAITQTMNKAAGAFEGVVNPMALNYSDSNIFREGMRDVGITQYGLQLDALSEFRAGATGDLLANLNKATIAHKEVLDKQFGMLAQDTPFNGVMKGYPISNAYDITPGQKKTAFAHIENEPTAFLGTWSFDELPSTLEDIQKKVVTEKVDFLKDLNTQIQTNVVAWQKATGKEKNKLADKLKSDAQDLLDFQSSYYNVYEPNGSSITPAQERKPRAYDGSWPLQVKVIPGGKGNPSIWSVGNITSDISGNNFDHMLGVTGDGLVLIPNKQQVVIPQQTVEKIITQTVPGQVMQPLKIKTTINVPDSVGQVQRQNIAQIIPQSDLTKPEYQNKLLFDLGKVWHYQTGQLGKEVFGNLPYETQQQIKSWVGSSNSGMLREWERTGAPQYDELYKAYEPFRDALRKTDTGAQDGTVFLWRGQRKSETTDIQAGRGNNLVSMTTNYGIAKKFAGEGGDVLGVWVPIDDILMPVGGLGSEWEFIVQNHTQRTFGSPVKPTSGIKAMTHEIELPPDVVNKAIQQQVGGKTQIATKVTQSGTPIAVVAPPSNWDALNYEAQSSSWLGLKRAADAWTMEKGAKINIGPDSHWTQLDYARTLIDKFGLDNMLANGKLTVPEAWKTQTLEKLNYSIAAGKYDSFTNLMKLRQAQTEGLIKTDPSKAMNLYDIEHLLNLADGGPDSTGPMTRLFSDLYAQGTTDFKESLQSWDHVLRLTQESANMEGGAVSSFVNKTPKLWGDNLTMDWNNKPILALRKDINPDMATNDALALKAADQRIKTQDILSNASAQYGADLVQTIYGSISDAAWANEARQTFRLLEGTQSGKQIISTGDRVASTNDTLRAITTGATVTDREGEQWIANRYSQPFSYYDNKPVSHTDVWNLLRARGNDGHLTGFNQYVQSKRYGFRVSEAMEIPGQNGGPSRFAYILDPASETYNKRLWQRYLPDVDWNPDAEGRIFLPRMSGEKPDGTPLQLTDLAHLGVMSVSDLYKEAGANANALRALNGKNLVNLQDFHVPPPDLSREHVGYLLYPDGRPKQVISGRSDAELRAKMDKEIANLSESERGQVLKVTQNTMEKYWDVTEDVFFDDLKNYADAYNQTGAATGAIGSRVLDSTASTLNDTITAINNQFFRTIRRTRAAAFEGEINHAKMLHEISGYDNAGKKEMSIWQSYINTIYGGQALTPQSQVGMIYRPIENLYDSLLQRANDKALEVTNNRFSLNMGENLRNLFRSPDKEFETISRQLGEHNPFQNVQDYLRQSFNYTAPPTMKSQMAGLNKISTLLTLRLFDIGNAVLNGLSLAANTPAVINSLKRMPGEETEAWANRISAYGSRIGESEDIAIFNPMRLAVSAEHKWWNDKEFQAAMERASNAGYFGIDAMQLQKTLSQPQEGYIQSLLRKWNDRYFSVVSDRSEEWARKKAFGMGYLQATEGLGIQNEKDAFVFAHKFADSVLANYRPQNKPQIFQGAVGMPLGLFQTFAWNYFERILGYVQNRQYRALATQYAMQASVFGAKTVPGFDQFTSYIANANNGIDNPVDSLRNRFGDGPADLILYGAVSNIPKLFANDGISLWTRGDANLQRVPGMWSMAQTPSFELMSTIYNILAKEVGSIREEGRLSPQRTMEILGTYLTNRPLRNLAQMLAGVSVDQSGEVISNEVRSGLGIASRLMGLKPMTDQKQSEALASIKATQAAQADKLETLRETTRSAMRGGEFDGPAIENALRFYVQNGGTPSGFGRWLRDTTMSAYLDKSQRKLFDLLSDPLHSYDTLRVLHAMHNRDDE